MPPILKKGLWEKIELYILSLWFLFLLLIIVTIKIPTYWGSNWVFIGFKDLLLPNLISLFSIIFLALGSVFYFRFKYRIQGSDKISAQIVSIEDVNYEHLAFLTTYIIPLICFDLSVDRYVFALGLLLVVIGIIYVKTDKFYANPTLAILDFKIYKVSLNSKSGILNAIVIISREKLKEGDLIIYKSLDEKVYFARKANDNRKS